MGKCVDRQVVNVVFVPVEVVVSEREWEFGEFAGVEMLSDVGEFLFAFLGELPCVFFFVALYQSGVGEFGEVPVIVCRLAFWFVFEAEEVVDCGFVPVDVVAHFRSFWFPVCVNNSSISWNRETLNHEPNQQNARNHQTEPTNTTTSQQAPAM